MLPTADAFEAGRRERQWIEANSEAEHNAVRAEVPPVTTAQRPPFKRLWVRGRLLRWWLVAGIVVDAVIMGLTAIDYSLLSDAVAGRPDDTALLASEDRMAVAGMVLIITFLVTILLWLAWFHRAYRNLRSFGIRHLNHRPGWAIGAWFVPIYSLFKPKAMANDIWRGSDPDPPAGEQTWEHRPVSPLLHWWWALWLLNIVVNQVSFRLWRDADTLEAERTATIADLVALPVDMVSAILAVLVVQAITRRQGEKAERLDGHEAEPQPSAEPSPAPAAA